MSTRLTDVASVIRSKNAGPYELTFDIIFTDRAVYHRVVATNAVNRRLIGRLFHITDDDILELVTFDPAAAIKITIRRPRTAGDLGETDVYGAQQHAPLLELELDLDRSLGVSPRAPHPGTCSAAVRVSGCPQPWL